MSQSIVPAKAVYGPRLLCSYVQNNWQSKKLQEAFQPFAMFLGYIYISSMYLLF